MNGLYRDADGFDNLEVDEIYTLKVDTAIDLDYLEEAVQMLSKQYYSNPDTDLEDLIISLVKYQVSLRK